MKLSELRDGLINIKRGIDEFLKNEERAWKELPWYIQAQFVEDAKIETREAKAETREAETKASEARTKAREAEINARETKAELRETDRKLQEKNTALDQEKQKNANYKEGPNERRKNSAIHVAAIYELMNDKLSHNSTMSEATARRTANKSYGMIMGRRGPYFRDENYLRRKLKEYRKSKS